MAFSLKLAPGVRVSASSRGVRTSLGPRVARMHVGRGRTGFSTGIGPVGFSTTVGPRSPRRPSNSGGSSADPLRGARVDRDVLRPGEVNRLLEEAAATQAKRRLEIEEARRLHDLMAALLEIHHADFQPASRPIAPAPPPIDESTIVERHMSAAKARTNVFDRPGRAAAIHAAREAAAAEVAYVRAHYVSERQRWQEQADAWWQAMVSNEPATVMSALVDAFEDNDAAAAAVGLTGDEVSLVVVVPDKSAVPTHHVTDLNAATGASIEPITMEDRDALYLRLIAGHVVVTVKEAFAVAPAVRAARIVAVRAGERVTGEAGSADVLLAARLERDALAAVDWNADEGALQILHDAAAEIVINPAGPRGTIRPINLAGEPEIAAVLDVVEFVDERPLPRSSATLGSGQVGKHVSASTHHVPVTEFDALHHAAGQAQQFLERGAGIAGQIAAGDWDADLTAEQARDLTDCLAETAEVARAMRNSAGELKFDLRATPHWPGSLPLNRKERFFTGTVFPGLVAGTGFWHIQRLLDLFGVPATAQVGEFAEIQFLTEYGFAESVYTDEDRAKWGNAFTRETPDIVIAGPDWLLAIEAKMYHSPSAASLNEQMAAQAPIVEHWRNVLHLVPERVVHALLLPERLAARERNGLANHRVVTWEALLEAFRPVGPRYWASVLADALERHPDLESRTVNQPNAEAVMTGTEIVNDAMSDSPTIGFVGRAGGSLGARFAADIETGKWRSQKYQVRATAVEATNRNWMPVAAFLAAVAMSSGE